MVDEIRTERLLLRRARGADSGPMHKIMSDPKAMRFWSTLPHATLAETEAWIASMISATDGADDFIIERDGRLIGKLGCWRLPELGYLLDPQYWGQGFASEALSGFIAHRRRRGPGMLTADTDPRNGPSIRLLQRHGFRETGRATRTWLIGDEWFDSVYWRLDF